MGLNVLRVYVIEFVWGLALGLRFMSWVACLWWLCKLFTFGVLVGVGFRGIVLGLWVFSYLGLRL